MNICCFETSEVRTIRKIIKIICLVIVAVAVITMVVMDSSKPTSAQQESIDAINSCLFRAAVDARGENYGNVAAGGFPDKMSIDRILGGNWKYTYIFKPGTTRDEIEGITGVTDKTIPKVIKDGYIQFLQVNLYGPESEPWLWCSYYEKGPYIIDFGEFTDNYIRIDYDTDPIVKVTNQGEFTKFEIVTDEVEIEDFKNQQQIYKDQQNK